MREMKFRIYHKGKFYYWGFFHEHYGSEFIGPPMLSGLTPKICAEMSEQYTGLKDKNGREIYEGDIVHHIFGSTIVARKIEFRYGSFGYCNSAGDFISYANPECLFYSGGERLERVEVIGNIHENPELLEAQ